MTLHVFHATALTETAEKSHSFSVKQHITRHRSDCHMLQLIAHYDMSSSSQGLLKSSRRLRVYGVTHNSFPPRKRDLYLSGNVTCALIPSTECSHNIGPDYPYRSAALLGPGSLQSIATVPMGLCWRTYTNTDRLLCHPDLKALLHHVCWLRCHCWQECGGLEAAEGFATSSVTLAHLQSRDASTSGDKACLFLLTHLYAAYSHTVRSSASGEWLTDVLQLIQSCEKLNENTTKHHDLMTKRMHINNSESPSPSWGVTQDKDLRDARTAFKKITEEWMDLSQILEQ